jgi:hypothetical protein
MQWGRGEWAAIAWVVGGRLPRWDRASQQHAGNAVNNPKVA